MSVLLQALSEQLQYRPHAALHSSAALDLKSMVQDLEFKSIEAIERAGASQIQVEVYQEKFQQVMRHRVLLP